VSIIDAIVFGYSFPDVLAHNHRWIGLQCKGGGVERLEIGVLVCNRVAYLERVMSSQGNSKPQKERNAHTFVFGEPGSFEDATIPAKVLQAKGIQVPRPFYEPIHDTMPSTRRCRPKGKTRDNNTDGNAYIFGKPYPPKEYAFVTKHGNDAGRTGFIDPSLWTGLSENQSDELTNSDDSPKAISELRRLIPGLVFQGSTVGGDVGASLWKHTGGPSGKGEIDGLVIDNNCYFRGIKPSSSRSRPQRKAWAFGAVDKLAEVTKSNL
jgi:hypothetical protein